MKKLFIALLACAAVVSCSKSDITYDEQPQEIGLAPFAKKSTKAAVDGTDYPTGLNMYVFANIQGEGNDGSLVDTWTAPYFKNALFAHDANGIFSGDTPYYWPNVKSLKFTGVSASGNVNNGSTPSLSANTATMSIELENYSPGNGTAAEGDNDLMWFARTQAYTKTTGTADTHNKNSVEVDGHFDVTMLHACSWITIKIQGDKITGADNSSWKIMSLTVQDLATTGDVVLSDAAAWTESTTTTDVKVHESTGGTALTEAGADYTKLATSGVKFNDFIIIPQATKDLVIEYSYVSQKGATDADPDITITEQKSVSLAFNGTEEWQPGVHYTYTITIGTNEILIESVAYDWTEYENGQKPTIQL